MKVKFKKLDQAAIIPSYAKEGDAGLDLVAINEKTVDGNGFGYIEYGTGIAVEIPPHHVGLLFPRSSISNTGLIMANSVGVIDSGYRGEIKLRFRWVADSVKYKTGERVAQLVIVPCPEVELIETEEFTNSERGEGGFGHTGN
jgi:dUTP pyrophosphatase